MTGGRLIAFVGPSGVGKDSVMAALAEAHNLTLVRRVITRPSEAGGEDFEGVSAADFAARKARGAFILDWEAHGLSYGIEHRALTETGDTADRLINLSRAVLLQAQAVLPRLVIFNVTAPREVLRARLTARGREDAEEIARRLDRARLTLPEGVRATEIDNSGTLAQTVATVSALLYPESGTR